MSRSYKKNFYACDNKGKAKKRYAWKKVRQWLKDHPEELLSQNNYKKIYESWDICDYKFHYTWEEFWESQLKHYEYRSSLGFNQKEPDMKDEYKFWCTHYKMK